jgi:hypothetical protein
LFTHDELSGYTHDEINAGALEDYPGIYALFCRKLVPGAAEYPVLNEAGGLVLTRNKGESWTSGVLSFTAVDKTLYVTTPYGMHGVYFDGENGAFKAYRVPVGLEGWFTSAGLVRAVTSVTDSKSWAYGYAFTLVRRPGNAGEKRKDYVPGDMETPERVAFRAACTFAHVPGTYGGYPAITLPTVDASMVEDYGFTHIRVYRTDNLYGTWAEDATEKEKIEHCKGGSMFFLCDVPVGTATVSDNIPEGALLGEMNSLSSSNYTFPPTPGITYYFKGRMYIGDKNGQVYYSEIPGGDGGTDLEGAQMAVNKYALWFRPLYYRLDLAAQEGYKVTGISSINDDLILFSPSDVYMVASGDPANAPLIRIEDKRGCIYPESIAKIKIKGENALFYQSDSAPMVVLSRGYVEEFSPFKIAELYKRTDGELATAKNSESYGAKAATDGNGAKWCSAAYWDDVLWLFYKLWDSSEEQIYGCLMREDASGAFKIELGSGNGGRVRHIAATRDNKAYAISEVFLVSFLVHEGGQDTFTDETVNMRVVSRKLTPGPLERNFAELFRIAAYTWFTQKESSDRDEFTLQAYNNRYVSTHEYYGDSGNKWVTGLLPPPAGSSISETTLRRGVSFVPKAGFSGDFFQYAMTRSAPGEGRDFAFYGVEMEVLPRAQLDSENWAGAVELEYQNKIIK